jgi:hypothetical protein
MKSLFERISVAASLTRLEVHMLTFIFPAQMLTMDFRPNRVNVAVDANGRITRVHHG